jgi:hypothetical protein
VCRPTVFEPALDTVAINQGDGRFLEQQAECGLELPQGRGLGIVVADFNGDQKLDLFVANDMSANFLLINDGAQSGRSLTFHDEAVLRGVAYDEFGLSQACMGVACADLNRDAIPDLYVTNFAQESNTLYLSQTEGFHQDVTQHAGLRKPSIEPLGFGTQFVDVDNDGLHDVIVLNGHIDEFANQQFQMKPQLFRGLADCRFSEVFANEAGAFFDQLRLGRALALLDWNRDGLVDFVATDLEQSVALCENVSSSHNKSLRVRFVGTRSNRDAIGTKVRVTVSPNDVRSFQVTAGDGYQCNNERVLRIGVGELDSVTQVEITWPSGDRSSSEEIHTNKEWIVVEGVPNWISLPSID